MNRTEIARIKAELRRSPSLRRKWGFRPTAKRFSEEHICLVAMNGFSILLVVILLTASTLVGCAPAPVPASAPSPYPYGQNGTEDHPDGYDGWISNHPDNPNPGVAGDGGNGWPGGNGNGGKGGAA